MGSIEVITGCMFAGKTEELIRRIHILERTNNTVLVFKPAIDNRYSKSKVVSHDGSAVEAIEVTSSLQILEHLRGVNVDAIAIDEIQFFDDSIVHLCEHLADAGYQVIVNGLDKDFRGEPFGVMPNLLSRAEIVTKLTSICTVCKAPANRTQRLIDGQAASFDDPIVLVGASEAYEPRCRKHHVVVNRPVRFK